MGNIIAAQTWFPEHRYSQNEIMKLIKKIWPNHEQVIERLTSTSGVNHRNLILPLERYRSLEGFGMRNGVFIEEIMKTLEKALIRLQEKTGFDWKDIGIITSTTVTGIAVPSLDARLMNKFPIPANVIRNPLFGLGCLGGVAALNRTKDLLNAYPKKLAIVTASEACSLTFQFDDINMANLVACSLFGDGTAAVLMAGNDHPLAQKSKLRIIDSEASFYPNTERIMGWDIVDSGFKVVLSGNVPEIVEKNLEQDVRTFLLKREKKIIDINNLISHPGGPKVLKALAKSLKKEESYLKHSWESLRDNGNMSSVSVLNVLERSLDEKTLIDGYALALALGPAFNSEMSLMKVGS